MLRARQRARGKGEWLARHNTIKEMVPTLSLVPVSMGKEQRVVCSGVLVVEVEAAVLLKLGSSPSRNADQMLFRIYKSPTGVDGTTAGRSV